MLHAINDIATQKANATTSTINAVQYLLHYTYSNPDAAVVYCASDMVLHTDSDAAYLIAPQAQSRTGGYHWIGSKDHTRFNGPIHVLAKVIKSVMSSAMEAQIAVLFMNAQPTIEYQQILIDMGHPQPSTLMQTDSKSADGIIHGTMKQKWSKAIDIRFN